MIFEKSSEMNVDEIKQSKLVLFTNFRTMNQETVDMFNTINATFLSFGFKMILLSWDINDKLNCPTIKIPFSLKDWAKVECDAPELVDFNKSLIDIDMQFNDDGNEKHQYKNGLDKCAHIAHKLAQEIKPAYLFLWSSTLPQSIILKNVFSNYFIPTYFVERGFLPETLMFEENGIGAFSLQKTNYQINNFYNQIEHYGNYEVIKNYYLEKRIGKHSQGEYILPEEYLKENNINDKKIVLFFGQWDVAIGVSNSFSNSTIMNSPIFANTQEAFIFLSNSIREIPDTILIFKPHPFDKNKYSTNIKEGIIVENNTNIHTLIGISDVIAVLSTTVQYEALLYEKPILLLGNSMLNGLRIGYELDSKESLTYIMKEALEKEEFRDRITNSKKFINYISSEYLISVENSNPVNHKIADYISHQTKHNYVIYLKTLDEIELEEITNKIKEYFNPKIETIGNFKMENQKTINILSQNVQEKISESENLIQSGNLEEAEKLLINIIAEMDPESIDAANNLSVVWIMQNRFEEALDLINQILDKYPNDEIATENLKYINQNVLIETQAEVDSYESANKTTNLHLKYNLPQNYQDLIGGGDFVKVGEDLLEQMIKACNIKQNENILDIGCGLGRLALPFSNYLNSEGSYTGFDIVKEEIDWCNKVIVPKNPNFKFYHSDVYNFHYNPTGSVRSCFYKFPEESNKFDFIFLTSVFTHMLSLEIDNYLSEIARVLKPGGRCFITYFLMNKEVQLNIDAGNAAINFASQIGEFWLKDVNDPEAAVCFEEKFIIDLYNKHKLKIVNPVKYGQWSGRENYFDYQDVIIATK